MPQELSVWENGLLYGLALACSIFSTLATYYFTCKYVDVVNALKGAAETKKSPSYGLIFTHIDRKTLMKLILTLLVAFGLELFALAFLPLIIIAPLSMLFFVYAAIYSVLQARYSSSEAPLDKRFIVISIFTVLFIALAVYSGTDRESALEILDVQSKAQLTRKTIIYAAILFSGIVSLYLLQRSAVALQIISKSLYTSVADVNTVLKGVLIGLVRGQSALLTKLFAEKLEGSLRVHHENTLVFYLIPSLWLLFILFYSYCFHKIMSTLNEQNPELLMPVYKLTYIVSTLTGAALYLEEFILLNVKSTTIYAISITSLLFLCVILCFVATSHHYMGDTTNLEEAEITDVSDELEGNDDELALTDQLEDGKMNGEGSLSSPGPAKTEIDRERSCTYASPRENDSNASLWKLSLRNADENFILSKAKSSIESTLSSLRDRSKSAPFIRGFPASPEPVDEVVNCILRKDTHCLDYEYPESDYSLVLKQGRKNPHADGINSSWVDPGEREGEWKVRGPNYFKDQKKIPSWPTRMFVAAIDWYYSPDKPVKHMSLLEGGYVQCNQAGREDRPFMFVINFMVPGQGNYVNYFVKKPGINDQVFDKMLIDFIQAEDDTYRNERFKLIPGVLEGNFIVRRSIGNKPALIGRRLDTFYHKGDNYFEVTIDVGSSTLARSVMGGVKGFASSLVLHMGFLLESKSRKELPERVLAGVDLYRPVMKPRQHSTLEKSVSQMDALSEEEQSSGDDGYQTA